MSRSFPILQTILLGFALVCVVFLPAISFGWGNEGHQTVGAIADRLLVGSKAAQEVNKLLKQGETLSKVSIWADCAKGYCGPLTTEMHEFVSANPKHHNYHFTDIPFQKAHYDAKAVGSDEDDVVHIIQQAIEVLRGHHDAAHNPHGFTKRQALLLLAHLVGDIHQPLHVGTAYVNDNDEYAIPTTAAELESGQILATHGDNYLLIGSRLLHAYWDSNVVKYAMRRAQATSPHDYADHLLEKYPGESTPSGDASQWPKRWADDALQMAKLAHKDVTLGEREEVQDRHNVSHFAWPIQVPPDYSRLTSTAGEHALVAAGKHLAQLLIAIWPDS